MGELLTPAKRAELIAAAKEAEKNAADLAKQAQQHRERARLQIDAAQENIDWPAIVRLAFLEGVSVDGYDAKGAAEMWPYSEAAKAIEWDAYEKRKAERNA